MALTDAEKTDIAARIASLEAAVGSGLLNVRHGDTSTTFQTIGEMNKAIENLKAQLGTRRRSRVRYVYQAGKGL